MKLLQTFLRAFENDRISPGRELTLRPGLVVSGIQQQVTEGPRFLMDGKNQIDSDGFVIIMEVLLKFLLRK